MDKAKKGQRKEFLAKKELIKQGYTVVFKSVRRRFGMIDFANLFDIVAISNSNKKWKFISVKHFGDSNNYLEHQKNISSFREIYGIQGMEFELWLWKKGKWVGGSRNKSWQRPDWKIVDIK